MCKYYKLAGYGDSTRAPVSVQRRMGGTKRWNRHDIKEKARNG